MLTLILISLVVALVWLGRRHWQLRRGVRLLSESLNQRRSFLHDNNELQKLHPAWHRLVSESGALLKEVQRLRQQRAGQLSQLEITLGSLREGVLVVDANNYILLANPAVGRIFPSARDLVGRRLETVLHSAEFLGLLEDVRGGRDSAQRQIEFFEHGRTVWIDATGAIVSETREQDGPWCLFVLHDVSRQKELELMRKDFVANVSHELKTPISVIKGYADTLCDDGGTMSEADRTSFARTIQRHAGRLAAIVDDLLALSRLESGAPVIQPIWLNLDEALRGVAEEFGDRLMASGHRLALASAVGNIEVQVDPLHFGQALANLLENAQKYTPKGTSIELGARRTVAGTEAEIWVADTGPGIPAADLPRIFERFYRVEKGRAREKGGTGLGLSIVKHIIQLHGGRVAAESTVGQGTRIAFWLPARSRIGGVQVAASVSSASGDYAQ